jgi:tetratricopeptide (TPR) repeat protein
MRPALIALGIVGAGVLGAVQFASMSLYGDLANVPAVPALLSPGWGIVLASELASPRAPAALRAAYAQALIHRGQTDAAAMVIAGLPAGTAAAELSGQLAETRGQPTTALAAFARAGDLERAQRLIDDRVDAGQLDDAARYEQNLADTLTGNGQAAVRARALWRLGQITQLQAQAAPAQRAALERAALDLYEQALAAAPNEETYLLAAGQQALTLGDKPLAIRYYLRALDAVPDSADARAGLLRARS